MEFIGAYVLYSQNLDIDTLLLPLMIVQALLNFEVFSTSQKICAGKHKVEYLSKPCAVTMPKDILVIVRANLAWFINHLVHSHYKSGMDS